MGYCYDLWKESETTAAQSSQRNYRLVSEDFNRGVEKKAAFYSLHSEQADRELLFVVVYYVC
jgi:hypothetical protein